MLHHNRVCGVDLSLLTQDNKKRKTAKLFAMTCVQPVPALRDATALPPEQPNQFILPQKALFKLLRNQIGICPLPLTPNQFMNMAEQAIVDADLFYAGPLYLQAHKRGLAKRFNQACARQRLYVYAVEAPCTDKNSRCLPVSVVFKHVASALFKRQFDILAVSNLSQPPVPMAAFLDDHLKDTNDQRGPTVLALLQALANGKDLYGTSVPNDVRRTVQNFFKTYALPVPPTNVPPTKTQSLTVPIFGQYGLSPALS